MENKLFELGILIGRFQTFHSGHEDIFNKAVQICERVGVFVGSSQEKGTYKNPFSYETRERILKKVFGDSIYVFPLPDIGVGNNSKWGDYVLENVIKRFGKAPDLLVSGKEERRLDWFDSINGVSVAELYVPKTINISATAMREMFLRDDYENWKRYTNPVLWDEYENLRQEVLLSKDNTFTDSI